MRENALLVRCWERTAVQLLLKTVGQLLKNLKIGLLSKDRRQNNTLKTGEEKGKLELLSDPALRPEELFVHSRSEQHYW